MKNLLCTLAVILATGTASATTVIYDEGVSGDLSGTTASPTALGTISDGFITGSLDSGTRTTTGSDPFDVLTFTLTETLAFSMSIENEVFTTSSGLIVFGNVDGGPNSAFFNSSFPSSLAAGFYTWTLVPISNEGSLDYTLQFGDPAPVPLPAGLALYGPLLLGVGAVAARRRRRAAKQA